MAARARPFLGYLVGVGFSFPALHSLYDYGELEGLGCAASSLLWLLERERGAAGVWAAAHGHCLLGLGLNNS